MSLSDRQISMLMMFDKGWGFKLYNERPGSWNTYWSLRRRGLLSKVSTKKRSDGNLISICKLTKAGHDALLKHKEKAND